jgi:hypothetical protein
MPIDERFTPAYLALLITLWIELDRLLPLVDADERRLVSGAEIVRLELTLLEAACERLAGRGELTALQAAKLRVVLDDLKYLFDPDPDAVRLPADIEAAQDRLYDEIATIAALVLGSGRTQ